MREVALFVEDYGHRQIIGALVRRIASDNGLDLRLDWRSARHGHGAVAHELREYLRDLRSQDERPPDLIVVATDANCMGFNQRIRELGQPDVPAPMIVAVPDPHVERWLLLDGAAFRAVFGRGCDAPDQKCSRQLYKRRLAEAISATGTKPPLGGIEYADEVMREIDIERASRADRSFGRFVDDLRGVFRSWEVGGRD